MQMHSRSCVFSSAVISSHHRENHRRDLFRETWHLGNNRAIFFGMLCNFSLVWRPPTLILRLSELQSRLLLVLWQSFGVEEKKKGAEY